MRTRLAAGERTRLIDDAATRAGGSTVERGRIVTSSLSCLCQVVVDHGTR